MPNLKMPNLIQEFDLSVRHCERSEAIHGTTVLDCFATLAMTD
jgi:hypothetical protein